MTPEELVKEFSCSVGTKKTELRQMLIELDKPAVPLLFEAYRSKIIDRWDCYETILLMKPSSYSPVIDSARLENDEAITILRVLENHRMPVPEAISVVVDGLNSDNVAKLISCLLAILHLYPLIEVHNPEKLHEFLPMTDRLLGLLRHEKEAVREHAANCIAVSKPTQPYVLPTLMTALKEALKADSMGAKNLIQAIGMYGAQAEGAIPLLVEAIYSCGYRYTKIEIARTFEKIGKAAHATIPILEEIRDSTEFATKSDLKFFRQQIQKAINGIQKASQTDSGKTIKEKGDPYLIDLINRLGDRNDMVATSATGTSHKAREELLKLNDESLIPKIQELFNSKLSRDRFYYMALILGSITHNTDSAEGRSLIMSLFSKENLRRDDINCLINAASKCKLPVASSTIRRLLIENNGYHISAALNYFGTLKDESAIDDIGSLMRENRERLLSIFALEKIGSLKAVPYLLEMAGRELTSKKKEEVEWRYYSFLALGELNAVSAVPDLINMLSDIRYTDWTDAIMKALFRIDDKQAYTQVIQYLNNVLDKCQFTEYWTTNIRTKIINGLDYIRKIGMKDEPEVSKLIARIKEKAIWSKLLTEEKAYISEFYSS